MDGTTITMVVGKVDGFRPLESVGVEKLEMERLPGRSSELQNREVIMLVRGVL